MAGGERIGIVTTVGTYYQHLPQWSASIEALDRKPDLVVIAASEPWRAWNAIGLDDIPVRVVAVDGDFLLSRFLNAAIEACDADWIAWIGADDAYRPCALDGLDGLPADILTYGMQIEGRGTWRGGLLSDARLFNPIPCGSPFRRWVWEAMPFQEHLFPYEDWGFWIAADHHGARAIPSGRIDFTYRLHDDQVQHDDHEATRRIQSWAGKLSASGSPHGTGPDSSTG